MRDHARSLLTGDGNAVIFGGVADFRGAVAMGTNGTVTVTGGTARFLPLMDRLRFNNLVATSGRVVLYRAEDASSDICQQVVPCDFATTCTDTAPCANFASFLANGTAQCTNGGVTSACANYATGDPASGIALCYTTSITCPTVCRPSYVLSATYDTVVPRQCAPSSSLVSARTRCLLSM
jgi:hypothetical protein